MARPGPQGRKSVKQIFQEKDILSPADMRRLEESLQATSVPLQQLAVEMGLVEKAVALQVLSREWRQKAVDFDQIEPNLECVKLVSESLARKGFVLPFAREENLLLVAMADPLDFSLVEDIQLRTGMDVRCYLAMPNDITRELDKIYGTRQQSTLTEEDLRSAAQESTKNILESLQDTDEVERFEEKMDVMEVDASAPEVEKIINASIITALQKRGSDIHFEPFEDMTGRKSRLVIRIRVDGVLQEAPFKVPWAYRFAVLAKIKIMTGSMNITERRVPQSGRIQVMAKGRPIELRVETIPTVYGESASLRILDRKNVQVDINKLGLLPGILAKFLDQLKGVGGKKNYGMILVTGPTGSGKSTTLYAALNHINRPGIRIITAENPVEYNIDGIIQVPVNPDIRLGQDKKFDFANALRSFLRADPDVIMVGEIRDQDTARIAMEAAMTGHMVFATLHTNDAPSTVARLVEMGIPSYMVVSTIKCVLAQRLCRSICSDCKYSRSPAPEEMAVFEAHQIQIPPEAAVYEGKGCASCGDSGYIKRMGIHELMLMDEHVRRAAITNLSLDHIKHAAQTSPQQMKTLVQDGLMKVLSGVTTIREVLGESID